MGDSPSYSLRSVVMTVCAIGYFTEDNTIRSVFCENEGFIDGVGFTLIKKYSGSWEVVETLIEKGNLNYLSEDDVEYLDDHCINEYESEVDYIEHANEYGCEYIYLYAEDEGQPPMWNVARPDTEFVPIVVLMMSQEEGYLQGVA
jgi:hypothetical protein